MVSRLKAILADFFQQADLVLLSLCCISTLFGMVLIFSATRYLESNKYVIVQGVACCWVSACISSATRAARPMC